MRVLSLCATTACYFGLTLGTAAAVPGTKHDAGLVRYSFQTIDNAADPAYNALRGINDAGIIAGYYGSGSAQDPSSGYIIAPPYGPSNYTSENYLGAAQTRIVNIDSAGDLLGYEVDSNGHGENFIDVGGVNALFPEPLYAINAKGYTIYSRTRLHGEFKSVVYLLAESTGRRKRIFDIGGFASGLGLNDANDAVGTGANQFVRKELGWAQIAGKRYLVDVPFAPYVVGTVPQAISNNGNIAGEVYISIGGSSSAPTTQHGFIVTGITSHPQYQIIDDPDGLQTTIYGINDSGQIVGSYVDGAGRTHGFLATPLTDRRRQ